MGLRLPPAEPAAVAVPEQRAAPGGAGVPRPAAPPRHPRPLAQPGRVRLRARAEPHVNVPDRAAREGRLHRLQARLHLYT